MIRHRSLHLVCIALLTLVPAAALGSCSSSNSSAPTPAARTVRLVGVMNPGQTVRGAYAYDSAHSEPEGATRFRWLLGERAVAGQTGETFTIANSHLGQRLTFEVTVVDVNGLEGTPVQASAIVRNPGGGGGGNGGGGNSSSIPCSSFSFGPGGLGGSGAVRGSQYAHRIVQVAAQIGQVSVPSGGLWSTPNHPNAAYYPSQDAIAYNPNFLNGLIQQLRLQEAGDSIVFHEVGHMWAFKTGRASCLGDGNTSQSRYRHEYQADSFAGAVLRRLNGNPQGSITVYNTVFAAWSQLHPPGAQRAQVFWDAWVQGAPSNFCGGNLVGQARGGDERLGAELERLAEIRDELLARGLNPYDTASDPAFDALWEGR